MSVRLDPSGIGLDRVTHANGGHDCLVNVREDACRHSTQERRAECCAFLCRRALERQLENRRQDAEPELTSSSAAGSLGWLRHVVAPGEPPDKVVAEAEPWPPGVEGLTFAPYLAGERTPHVDPNARAAFAGLSLRHDRGALVRAVLEGVAFGLRDSLELLRAIGVEPRSARVSGGGARSELWLRIVASVLELPLERTAAEEGAAFGAALLGGVAAGVFADVHEAVTATVRVRDTIELEPEWIEPYAEAYRRFRSLYPALRPLEDE